jgi:hypothetical protein
VVATSAQLTQHPQATAPASGASGLDDLGELDDHPF